MDEHGEERSLSNVLSDDGQLGIDLSHSTSSKDSIRRIPDLFKMRNEKAYTPYKFSIGPWHFGKTELLRTGQILKESFLKGLLDRFTDRAAKRRELEEAIHNVHDQARECYEGGDVYDEKKTLEVTKKEFEDMLLLDGCFIIELFRKKHVWQPCTGDDVLVSGAFSQVFYHDLLLLDNQIPWFVLEHLFDKTKGQPSIDRECGDRSLVELALKFFEDAAPHCHCYSQDLRRLESGRDSNNLHLLHLVWRFWVVSPGSKLPTFEECWGYRNFIPSATRLKEAGVKFRQFKSRHILDVQFNNGELEIPPLRITSLTESIFRNFIIFEQYSGLCIPWVTGYAILLDCLIDTSDDVDLMSRAGILDNTLNPEQTANFLNRVRDNTVINDFCYAPLCKSVNNYCKRRWPTWRASLIRNYFTKPWAIVSVVFATIVLFFTIMQVFYK